MDRFGDAGILLLYVAALFLFLRPGSKGPALVNAIADGVTGALGAVTGGGGWWGPK